MKRRPNAQKINLEKFKELFYEKQWTHKQLAEYFGVSVNGFGLFRQRHNLPPRGWANGIIWNKGKKLSEEHITRLVESHKGKSMGENNPCWKGGRYLTRGYWEVLVPEEFSKHKKYAFEHRYVMEKHLGRRLTSEEIIHHINGIKTDNRIENLELCSKSEHCKIHKFGNFSINHE